MRRDAHRRFTNFVFKGIQSIFWKHRFPASFPMASIGSPAEIVASSGEVATMGVATLGVGFAASCPMASRGSSSLIMASFVGVATLCVGLSQQFNMAFRGFYWLHLRF
jgi:hypothetical protein